MRFRTAAALLGPPLVAALISATSFVLSETHSSLGPREWVQVGAWVVFAAVFELLVLLPLTRVARSWKYQRAGMICASTATWSAFWFVWFIAVFKASAADAVIPALRMGLAGILVCGTFILLWVETKDPRQKPGNDPDA